MACTKLPDFEKGMFINMGIEYYDEKKEKKYEARIWIVLAVIGLVMFVITSFDIGRVEVYKRTGDTYIVIKNDGSHSVPIKGNNGRVKMLDVGFLEYISKEGEVFVYSETGDISTAVVQYSFWIVLFLFIFILMFSGSVYMIVRIYRE